MADNIPNDLPGRFIDELIEAIADAFRTKEKLGRMLRTRLNKKLHQVAPVSSNDMGDIAYHLIDNAEAQGWIADLIHALYQEVPRNVRVKSCYDTYQQCYYNQHLEPSPDIQPNFSPPFAISNMASFSHQEELSPPHTTDGFQKLHLVPLNDTQATIQATTQTSSPFVSHMSSLHLQYTTSYSLSYFRQRWYYCSANQPSRFFISRNAPIRRTNEALLSVLSNCPHYYSLCG